MVAAEKQVGPWFEGALRLSGTVSSSESVFTVSGTDLVSFMYVSCMEGQVNCSSQSHSWITSSSLSP
jgi:hypothetical protein